MNRGTTVAIIFVVVISLAAVDQFLARVESAEVRNTAERSYSKGTRLLQVARTGEAIDLLREAHSLDRQNAGYELELINALTAAGKTDDAEPVMTDLLQREPNDGGANLMAAHLMVRRGEMVEAEAYFHRAIYGRWARDGAARRIAVRMELIELLAAANRKQELLAELISLEAEAPADPAIQKRLGVLFLKANAPERAADVFQAVVAKNPQDLVAQEGLGETELEQGQYRVARQSFERAFALGPENASVRTNLETLNRVTELDPTGRQLTSAEKYRRSLRILEMSRAEAASCDRRTPEIQPLLAVADQVIAGRIPAHVTNEAAEGVLSAAEKLWRAGTPACGGKANTLDPESEIRSEALRLIMRKLAA